jgi:hypothetical protein
METVEVYNYPMYVIDQQGNVYKKSSGKKLKHAKNHKGYEQVYLYYTNKDKATVLIHRALMSTFCPCENMDILQVNHKDGNKLNNNLGNLEWCTNRENMDHAVINNLVSGNNIDVYCAFTGKFIGSYHSCEQAARVLGIDRKQFHQDRSDRPKIRALYIALDTGSNPPQPDRLKQVAVLSAYGVVAGWVRSMSKFCRDHNINESSMTSYVSRGNSYRGLYFYRTSVPLIPGITEVNDTEFEYLWRRSS